MASGPQRRTRAERVAAVAGPAPLSRELLRYFQPQLFYRVGIAVAFSLLVSVIFQGWKPAFPYRVGESCDRAIVAKVDFELPPKIESQRPIQFHTGQTIVETGQVILPEHIRILKAEYHALLRSWTWRDAVIRFCCETLLVLALVALTGVYLRNRESELITDLRRLVTIVAFAAGTLACCKLASADPWQAELVPLLLFAETVAIAYRRESALLLACVLALLIVFCLGYRLEHLLVLVGATSIAVLQLGRIRSRTKLIYAAGITAAGVVLITLCSAFVQNAHPGFIVLSHAGRYALWSVVAGFLMSGMLWFIERIFGVLTDIRLLELTDMSQPLLQELVRRAPGTYNHSIIVGTLAEAAAEAIGARGLLARVGAYYHDIGKLLKPEYFVENQPPGDDRHRDLMPAMSKLVIVAHVKDGVDLAKEHKLPRQVIDLIQQHHGTTLVAYFYSRAHEQKRQHPDAPEVQEEEYRYPGPKPQTKEAAVLMLADACESACRSLVDPTPSRIENVVREISRKRLEDGQFDESGLTLKELRIVEDTLIKSLVATYHARIRYPAPQPT